MEDVFRVVRISDQQEIQRFVDLVGACVRWVKDPHNLRVEQLPVGGATATRQIPTTECCATLRKWLPRNKHFASEDERKDMAGLINEACRGA